MGPDRATQAIHAPSGDHFASATARLDDVSIGANVGGVPTQVADEAFELAAAKLPIATKIVRRLGEGA